MKYFSFLILSFFILSFSVESNVSAGCPCCPHRKKAKGKESVQKVNEQKIENSKTVAS